MAIDRGTPGTSRGLLERGEGIGEVASPPLLSSEARASFRGLTVDTARSTLIGIVRRASRVARTVDSAGSNVRESAASSLRERPAAKGAANGNEGRLRIVWHEGGVTRTVSFSKSVSRFRSLDVGNPVGATPFLRAFIESRRDRLKSGGRIERLRF